MLSCGIYEIFKNDWFEVCERLLLKPVLSSGLPFSITYTSNWYLCFSFCIIIYSFVCRSSLQYYYVTVQYCTALIRSSRPVVFSKKGVLTNFTKIHKKTPALKICFSWSCRSTKFNFIKREIPAQISHNTFVKESFGRLLLHKHSLCLLSHHDLSTF